MKKILILLIFCLFLSSYIFKYELNEKVIVDSNITLLEAIQGSKAPKTILDSMKLLNVQYYSFDNKLHQGQLVINAALEKDFVYLFELIKSTKFPVKSVIPIVKYGWSDDSSMIANNTSAFNYRLVSNSNRPSNHSWGRAIDINPLINPAIHKDGRVEPIGAKYNIKAKGVIHSKSKIVSEMLKRQWEWGGNWINLKDYQHIQKVK
ncbi:MAG: M15 family metallopeptidase [Candidatus Kapabacteria bacterium]|nr:M15 family metallopeptidase [Candidatus Kapabacteria bacterium]